MSDMREVVALLRAADEDRAANLVAALAERGDRAAAEEPPQPRVPADPQAAADAHGRALYEQLQRQTTPWYSVGRL